MSMLFIFLFMVLAPNPREQIIKDHPQQNFVLAGHSLGGVMASRFVAVSNESKA